MAKKKLTKEDINPEIEKGGNTDTRALQKIAEKIESNTIVSSINDGEDADSFFKSIVKNLMDTKKDVSAKTEYLNVRENFTGAKLEFLADFGNMPYLKKFINHFEVKRISLERKGRKELLMALKEKEQEERAQQLNNLNQRFGLM